MNRRISILIDFKRPQEKVHKKITKKKTGKKRSQDIYLLNMLKYLILSLFVCFLSNNRI